MSGNISGSEANESYLAYLNDMYALQVLPAILCLAVLMLVGIVGNSLVLYIYIAKFKTTTVSTFISALAILDLFNCLVNIPYAAAVMRYNFTFGNSPFCKIMSFILPFINGASLFILIAVAADRFRKICRPLQKQTTVFIGKVAIAVCITFAAVVALPSIFLYGPRVVKVSEQVSGTVCSVSDEARQTLLPVVYNSIQFILFLVTTCTLITIYSMIWRQISKRRKLHQKGPKSVANDNSVNLSDKDCSMSDETRSPRDIQPCKAGRGKGVQRTTLMLFLTTVVFILSFLPFLGLMAANSVNKQLFANLQGALVAAFHLFIRSYYINSVSNPFIYSFCNERFRLQLKLIFKKR